MLCNQEDLTRFVRAELDVDDLERVLRHLEECRECAANLQVMVRLRANREEIREELEKTGPPAALPLVRRNWFAAVAAALILTVSGLVIILLTHSRPQTDLAALASLERFPYRPMILRGETQAPVELFNQAMSVYELNDLSRARRMLEDYLFQSPRDAEAYFYLGVCLYLLGDHAEALRALETGLSLRTIEPEEKYHWYLAQVYLKMRLAEPARRELRVVISFQGQFSSKAAAILERID
jgi:tetratricopeptide (TPR) repeat protein